MRARAATFALDRDFLYFWAGQSISLFGTQVSLLAIPLTAVITLGASASQMGMLTALETLPFLLIGLPAGAWIDRLRRRPVMIGSDLIRAGLLISIPITAAVDSLSLLQLYLVAAAVGVMTVFFDLAYQSYLPSLVPRQVLVPANSRLETSRSASQILGPVAAGGIVQLLTAPFALLIDAFSFLLSALFLHQIRAAEPAPTVPEDAGCFVANVTEGLRFVVSQPLLRAITGCSATLNLFMFMQVSVYILYATEVLDLSPALLGLILAAGGPGALLAALMSSRVTTSIGIGPAIFAGATLQILGGLAAPLAGGFPAVGAIILATGQFIFGAGLALYGINQMSLRQTLAPARLQGRMNASIRAFITGAIPVGSLLGGFAGEILGLWPVLLAGGLGAVLGLGWLVWSPMWEVKTLPDVSLESGDEAARSG